MIDALKKEKRLVVLRLALGTSNQLQDEVLSNRGSGQDVLFTVELGDEDIETVRVSANTLGVPRTMDEARSYRYGSESEHKMPDYALSHLKSSADLMLAKSDAPLWLQFDSSCGYLPMLPWEQMLQPGLARPLIRLPYLSLEPFFDLSALNVAICSSDPAAKAALPVPQSIRQIINAIVQSTHQSLSIHIFADAHFFHQLSETYSANPLGNGIAEAVGAGAGRQVTITVHNPQEAASYATPGRSLAVSNSSNYLDSPWLRWMSEQLQGQGTDIVHFLCHGYLSLDQGALAFAESPIQDVDRELARFVGPQMLAAFLNGTGASSVGFSHTRTNFSTYGLRLLADQLARISPGPLFLHEIRSNTPDTGLAETYGFLFGEGRPPTVESHTVALYCNPSRFPADSMGQFFVDDGSNMRQENLSKYTLADSETVSLLHSSKDSPPWLLASQRYLEQEAAQLVGDEPDGHASPAQEGAQDALVFVRNVLARHAIKEDKATQRAQKQTNMQLPNE